MARSFSKMTPHFCPDPNRDPDGNRNRQETVQTTEQTANNLERTGAESSRKQQTVARITAHNPEVAGSSPVSATTKVLKSLDFRTFSLLLRRNNAGKKLGQRSDPSADPDWLAVGGFAAYCQLVPFGCGEMSGNYRRVPERILPIVFAASLFAEVVTWV